MRLEAISLLPEVRPGRGAMPSEPDRGRTVPGSCDRFRDLVFQGMPTARRCRKATEERSLPALKRAIGGETSPLSRGGESRSLCQQEAAFVFHVLRAAGLDPEGYRLPPLIRRVPACLRALKAETPEAAARSLVEGPERVAKAVNALLIGTTSFFRDEPVFEQLHRRVIPGLLERCPQPRVWSAACSDGLELYSVAMLFAEHGGLGRTCFLGTDCRAEAVRNAKRGRYAKLALENGAAPEWARTYFQNGKDFLRVSPLLADGIDWEVADVLGSRPAGSWDMILCRNLAIYLAPEVVKTLWEHLAEALSPGGTLVVGKAEKVSVPGLMRISPCIYQKTPISLFS